MSAEKSEGLMPSPVKEMVLAFRVSCKLVEAKQPCNHET